MIELFWFFVFFTPAYVANMVPPFFRKLPFGYPIDGGRTWNGQPLLGKNKTWRGLILGTLGGGLVGLLLQSLDLPFVWWWGLVLGFAALFGDALKSLIKRQVGIKPGGRWMPFDQLDFLIVAWLASLFFVRFSPAVVIAGFAIVFGCTIVVQILGGVTGIKADKL